MPGDLQAGAVYLLDGRAGALYRIRPFLFRLEKELDWETTWVGTVYVTGTELDREGRPVEHRTLYVIRDGLFPVPGWGPVRGRR